MTDATDRDEDDEALAAEYALGLMAPEAQRVFAQRLGREPALRARLHAWQERLSALAEEVAPVAPPAGLKTRIETVLFEPTPRRRWSWTRFLGGAATAGVVVLALFIWSGPLAPPPALVAEIAAEDRALVFAARVGPAGDRLEVTRLDGAPAQGRVHELWLIAEGAAAPVSLGVLPADGRATVPLPAPLAASLAGGTLAVSDEPPGGSPTGQPTGAVLAVGVLRAG